MTYAIKVHNVTKTYRLGERKGSKLLSEALARRRSTHDAPARKETVFNALDDVSFDLEEGSAVGIIGRNGAGKTTLLKLISRVTRPTSGEIRIRGRVGSLLEVGTGFHPELTGRENVFMNGSMLGMRRSEILRKFDEIVAFADVERFIDTPVKRYSSGMYVRLAFAVAAHLEPEILVVDEVLAVGDAAFQRKCLGKMGDVSREGRTVLFVSHNIAAVQQLTQRAILLQSGRLVTSGPTQDVVDVYLARSGARASVDLAEAKRWDTSLSREVELLEAETLATSSIFSSEEDLRFRVRVRSNGYSGPFRISFTVYRFDGQAVGSGFCDPLPAPHSAEWTDVYVTTSCLLAPSRYYLWVAAGVADYRTGERLFDLVSEVCDFEVAAKQLDDGTVSQWSPSWGAIRLSATTEPAGSAIRWIGASRRSVSDIDGQGSGATSA